jgi:hypothetical protein
MLLHGWRGFEETSRASGKERKNRHNLNTYVSSLDFPGRTVFEEESLEFATAE